MFVSWFNSKNVNINSKLNLFWEFEESNKVNPYSIYNFVAVIGKFAHMSNTLTLMFNVEVTCFKISFDHVPPV